jgi:hypothetical protein
VDLDAGNMLERARGGVSFRRMSEKAPLLMLGLPKGSLEESTKNCSRKRAGKSPRVHEAIVHQLTTPNSTVGSFARKR